MSAVFAGITNPATLLAVVISEPAPVVVEPNTKREAPELSVTMLALTPLVAVCVFTKSRTDCKVELAGIVKLVAVPF